MCLRMLGGWVGIGVCCAGLRLLVSGGCVVHGGVCCEDVGGDAGFRRCFFVGLLWVCFGLLWVCFGLLWVCFGLLWFALGLLWFAVGLLWFVLGLLWFALVPVQGFCTYVFYSMLWVSLIHI